MARRRRATLIAVAATLAVRAAAADAPARVSVHLPACENAIDKAALTRALEIELAADGVKEVVVGDDKDALAIIQIEAQPCSAEMREVNVTIDDAATSKSVRRTMDVASVPRSSQVRTLALAVAELLRASWAELSMPNVPAPRDRVPLAVRRAVALRPATTERPPRAPTPLTLARLSLDAALFPAYQSVVIGPGVGVSLPIGPLRARGGGSLGFGRAYDALGTIDLQLASGEVGLLYGGGPDGVRFEIGPLLSVGYGWATGHPTSGATGGRARGVIVATSLTTALYVRLGSGWWSVAGLEAGGVLHGLDAQASNQPASGFGGPRVAVSLGIAREL